METFDYDENTGFFVDRKNGIVKLPVKNRMKKIVVWTLADIKNLEMLSMYTYNLKIYKTKIYVSTNIKISLHELVMGKKAPKGHKIDHKNSDGLDNREDNLRIITDSGNSHNRKKKSNTTSIYKGVSYDKVKKKWISHIRKKINYHLGYFEDEKEAAIIRDVWAVYLYRGEASLNVDENDNSLISKSLIEKILINGIPNKYKKPGNRSEKRELPKNIYKSRNGKRFRYNITINKKNYSKTFDTQKEAEDSLTALKKKIKNERQEQIVRNEDNIAVLKTYDEYGNVKEHLVDDDVWEKLSCTKWYQYEEVYASGNYKGKYKTLHIHIYENFIGEIKDGYSVDHIDPERPDDDRKDNLRLNTPSGQNHNQTKNKNSRVKYRGVSIESGKFVVTFDTKYISRHETEEEAALVWNELAIEKYKEFARPNKITTSNTYVSNYYNKDNIDMEFMNTVKTVTDLKEIFRARKDWKEKYRIYYHNINIKTYDQYRKLIINLLKEEKRF